MCCSYHKTTTNCVADCRARMCKRTDGNAHIAAAGSSRIKIIYSAYDIPDDGYQPECA